MSNTKAVEQRIEEIRNRLADITPGPWEPETGGPCVWHLGSGDTICTVNFDHQTGEHQPGEDQEFIARAPSDVAYLLDQLASIPAQIKAARTEERKHCIKVFSDSMEYAEYHFHEMLDTAAIRARGEAVK